MNIITNAFPGQSPISEFSDEIIQNLGVYVCVVDKDVLVLKTNFYNITHQLLPKENIRLGNVLRCKNGEDAGRCGDGEACLECPVRQAVTNGFKKHCGFHDVEADMRLYTSAQHDAFIDCTVNISAKYLSKSKLMVLTIRDVTKDKNLEKELDEARKKAENADLQKSIFVANMSHEMRTPLNAILGFSELLAYETDEKKKEDFLNIVKANNDLLLRLVNDILDLSRIEAGTLEFEYSDFDFNLQMRELESIFRLRVESLGVPVKVNFIPGQLACHLHTEQKRVQQVISNLLGNAVKNTHEGSITFGYEVRPNEIYCYVKDTGEGIPEDKQQEIFERFAKLDPKKQGAGLGLAISQMIIRKLNGEIGVTSQPGIGSTFWFTLPIQPMETKQNNLPEDEATIKDEPTGKQILIMETEQTRFDHFRNVLSPTYIVNQAYSDEELINGYLKGMADGMLMVIKPNDHSLDCVAAIRLLASNLPIVAIGSELEKERCMASGFDYFISYSELNEHKLKSVFRSLLKNT